MIGTEIMHTSIYTGTVPAEKVQMNGSVLSGYYLSPVPAEQYRNRLGQCALFVSFP